MIDVHCHVLPGLDDGAVDLEDSVAMVMQGEADGIDRICATPHIRHDHDVLIHELPGRVEELNAELDRRGVNVRITTGGEVAETAVRGLSSAEVEAVSLGGGGRWILLEPAPGPLGDSLVRTVEHLHGLGLRVLIAHPERHPSDTLVTRIVELVDAGALVQVTEALLAGEDSAPFMLMLARHGLVHFLASDAHSAHHGRPVRLSRGLARLQTVELLSPHLDWIACEGPAAMLRGEDVEPPFSHRGP
jgi:protein-tyrosine phosphatase